MAMDSVSLPVVSATTPPPPRASSAANTGTTPASCRCAVRAHPWKAAGQRVRKVLASRATSTTCWPMCTPRRVTRPRPDPRRRRPTTRTIPGTRQRTRARPRRRLSSWLRCPWLSSTRHRRRRVVLLHTYEDRPPTTIRTITTNPPSRTRWLRRSCERQFLPLRPQSWCPLRSRRARTCSRDEPRRGPQTRTSGHPGKLAVGTEAGGKPVERTTPKFASGLANDRNLPQAAIEAGESASAGDQFATISILRRTTARCQTLQALECSIPATPRSPLIQSRLGPNRPVRAGVNAGRRRSVRLKAQTPARAATDQAPAAAVASEASTNSPQPAVREAAPQASTTAVRRATSRVAAQAILDKVVRQDVPSKEAATSPVAATTAPGNGAHRTHQWLCLACRVGQGEARPTVARDSRRRHGLDCSGGRLGPRRHCGR